MKLKRAIEIPQDIDNELLVDGTIQRFEFCIELFWKALRRVLLENGIEAGTPKEAIQKAYQAKWINGEKMWIQMLRDRNLTSHTYEEETANDIYSRIPDYYDMMLDTLKSLEQRI